MSLLQQWYALTCYTVIYFFTFYSFSFPPLETTFLPESTPFLRQMPCFGGDWFPRGSDRWVLNFPLLNPKTSIFRPVFGLRLGGTTAAPPSPFRQTCPLWEPSPSHSILLYTRGLAVLYIRIFLACTISYFYVYYVLCVVFVFLCSFLQYFDTVGWSFDLYSNTVSQKQAKLFLL